MAKFNKMTHKMQSLYENDINIFILVNINVKIPPLVYLPYISLHRYIDASIHRCKNVTVNLALHVREGEVASFLIVFFHWKKEKMKFQAEKVNFFSEKIIRACATQLALFVESFYTIVWNR